MRTPRIGLDQWQALVAVVEAGSHARAAERLHKTQSTVTYSVRKIETLLGVKAFEIQGRKAVLTAAGELLYRRAKVLLEEAASAEDAARRVAAGWEAEIRVAMEQVFPHATMLGALHRFNAESPHTRVELFESVLGGTAEALLTGAVDLAVGPSVPQGFFGESLLRMRLLTVTHPGHALQKLGRPATIDDLRRHRQLVVRETGSVRGTRATVEAKQRWTVTHMATSIHAARLGHGYALLPEDKIREELASGALKPLALRAGGERYAELHLVIADGENAGPGVKRFAEILRETVKETCAAVASLKPAPSASARAVASAARPPSTPRTRAPRGRRPSS